MFTAAGIRGVEVWVFRNTEFHLEMATLRDAKRVVAGLGEIRKKSPHFFGGFEVKFGAVALALLIHNHGCGTNANQNIVSLMVRLFEEMNIVGGHEAKVKFSGKLDQFRIHSSLGIKSELGQLDEVIFRPKNIAIGSDGFLGLLHSRSSDEGRHLALHATAECDEAFGVSC